MRASATFAELPDTPAKMNFNPANMIVTIAMGIATCIAAKLIVWIRQGNDCAAMGLGIMVEGLSTANTKFAPANIAEQKPVDNTVFHKARGVWSILNIMPKLEWVAPSVNLVKIPLYARYHFIARLRYAPPNL